jgi:DNA repair exonuclease SbcCD ATPase subunit
MINLIDLKRKAKNIEDDINMKIGIKRQIQSDIDDGKSQIKLMENEIEILDKVLKVFQQIVDIKKNRIKEKVEKIISKGLKIVYDDSYGYELEYEVKREDIVAIPYVYNEIDDNRNKTEIVNARGGGIVDVVSFISRVTVLSAKIKELRQVLLADEPFKNVGAGNMENISKLLRWVSDILNIQFVIVTHEKELIEVADKIFRVTLNKGISNVVEEENKATI